MALIKLPKNTTAYISTDFAVSTKTSADYTVLLPALLDAEANIFFGDDVIREKLSSKDMVERLLDLAKKYDPYAIAIEKGVISNAVMPLIRTRMQERNQFHVIWEKTPSKDKQSRANPLRARFQQGKVFFPDTPYYHTEIMPEMLSFPGGKNDDYVDAASLLVTMLDELESPYIEPDEEDDSPEEDTYEWLMKRTQSREGSRLHVPDHFTGHSRKAPGDKDNTEVFYLS